jgi:multiple sugar transport system permease protein
LSNTRAGLALTYLGLTVPFCTWLLMGYFLSVPVELEEAGLVEVGPDPEVPLRASGSP